MKWKKKFNKITYCDHDWCLLFRIFSPFSSFSFWGISLSYFPLLFVCAVCTMWILKLNECKEKYNCLNLTFHVVSVVTLRYRINISLINFLFAPFLFALCFGFIWKLFELPFFLALLEKSNYILHFNACTWCEQIQHCVWFSFHLLSYNELKVNGFSWECYFISIHLLFTRALIMIIWFY